ncbi:MAG TPA: GMC family oxidoreductase [Solirubrobacterales bacterium]|nr:GMC family oxidoreductase [Solirubrobacterales bacterium]
MASAVRERRADPATDLRAPTRDSAFRERVTRWSLRGFIALDLLLLAGYALAVGGYVVGALAGSPLFPLIANSASLYVLLLCAAALALADLRRFRAMLLVIAGAHAVQVAALVLMVALHGLSGDPSILDLFELPAASVFAVWTAYALAVTVLFATLYRWAPVAPRPFPFERRVGWQEPALRAALVVMAAVFAGFLVLYVVRGLEGEADFPFLAASVSKDGVFLALAVLALSLPARWASLTLVIVVGHIVLVATNALLWGSVSGPAPVFGAEPPFGGDGVDVVRNWILAAGAVTVGLVAALWLYQRARYRLEYLWPPAVRALEAFADALFEKVPETVAPRRVAEAVDDYLAAFRGRAQGRVRIALAALYYLPILWRLAPFTALSRERRLEWAERRFREVDMAAPWPLGPLRKGVRMLIRSTQQFAYSGYYSQREGWETTGFRPFSERDGAAEAIAAAKRERPGLDVTEPWQVGGRELWTDVVVVGSGAAGAILAYRLAQAGHHVVVLERGPHIRPSQMTEDEMEMFAKLYSDGALQLSRDFQFQVTTGRCVGGSTTVNNGVCIDPPATVLDGWRRRAPGLDLAELDRAFARVRRLLGVQEQPEEVRAEAAKRLASGLERTGGGVERAAANIDGCLGCGYCNSGCAYGKKLSMLDSVLLWGQQRYGDRLKIISECEARRIIGRHGRAVGVKCRLSDGRRLRVNARERVIVSAGAIASSRLLQRSLIGGRNSGKGLTFNIRSAIAARYPNAVDSWAGLQITDARLPDGDKRWMVESWSAPVVSQAAAMPGWFGDHERNMRDLRRIGWAGVLVGAQAPGRVRRLPLPWNDTEFKFKPGAETDMTALKEAFEAAAEALFEAGAEEVMVPTHRRLVVRRDGATPQEAARELRRHLDWLVDDSSDMLNMSSAHPQGGNSISDGPKSGVVDADCRVHGYRNLYVCDASVFPTSITVNPQLTVMALAEYAAERMLARAAELERPA